MMTTKRKMRPTYFLKVDWILMAVFAVAIFAVNHVTHLPYGLLEVVDLIWVGLLVLVAGIIPKRGTALIVALISALLAAVLMPGARGVMGTFINYAVAGIAVEITLAWLGSPYHWLAASLAGIAGLVANFASKWLLGVVAGAPAGLVPTRLAETALTDVMLGFLGGFVACLILISLARAKIVDDTVYAD
jgi:ABC-type thiamin/hydroxymethylpyrimidine transport system permease subunit